jgi:hypothetical protein
MSKIFKNEATQKQFDNAGFVCIPLLDTKQVNDLVEGYASFKAKHEKIGLPYITTSHSNDLKLITEVDMLIQNIIASAIAEHLINYELLFSNFLIKMPVKESATDPHQDITFVDEEKYVSMNIWIALEDIDSTNGGMFFLKGSHQWAGGIRPTHDFPWPFEEAKDYIAKRARVFSAKAGDAFFFHHAVIHGSLPNLSTKPRLAAVAAVCSQDAPLIHYYRPESATDTLELYRMSKQAYLSFEKGKPPKDGVYLSTVNHEFEPVSTKAIASKLREQNSNWLKRIIRWIWQ